MKRKNIILLIIVVILILINVNHYVLPAFKNSDKNLENEVAELTLNANELVDTYLLNEESATDKYSGKIIEVTGFVKEITHLNNRITVILNSKNENFGVICDINTNQNEKIEQLKKHQKIRVKGICKGFLKDVIILNCSIDLTPNE